MDNPNALRHEPRRAHGAIHSGFLLRAMIKLGSSHRIPGTTNPPPCDVQVSAVRVSARIKRLDVVADGFVTTDFVLFPETFFRSMRVGSEFVLKTGNLVLQNCHHETVFFFHRSFSLLWEPPAGGKEMIAGHSTDGTYTGSDNSPDRPNGHSVFPLL